MLQITDSPIPAVQKPYPPLVKSSKVTERETAYYAALELVARIDEDLARGLKHYRNKAGALLTELDEVVRAVLDGTVILEEAA